MDLLRRPSQQNLQSKSKLQAYILEFKQKIPGKDSYFTKTVKENNNLKKNNSENEKLLKEKSRDTICCTVIRMGM